MTDPSNIYQMTFEASGCVGQGTAPEPPSAETTDEGDPSWP
jgi:hypothetical protein